jgi:acid stress-induced BolA-like protein IbaG/YrbA
LAAQRVVFDALGDLMEHEIHALSMRTLTPEDWSA